MKRRMNVKWRLAFRVILPLIVVGCILFSMAGGALYWMLRSLSAIEAERDFQTGGLQQIVETITKDKNHLKFNPKLLKIIHDDGGWLQRIDENGKVTDSFYAPPDVPSSYGPGELTAYWLGKEPFPYQLSLWIQEKDSLTHTLIYGRQDREGLLIHRIRSEGSWDGQRLELPASIQQELRTSASWLQLLDAEGKQLAAFNKPQAALDAYSVQEFALRSVYKDRYNSMLSFQYDERTGLTWALNTPLPGAKPGVVPAVTPEVSVLITGIGALLVLSMAVFVALSLWFGHRFGAPLLHIMSWLRQLDGAQYLEPDDRLGRPRSRNRHHKRKLKYRAFGEVLDSLESLSATLRQGEKLREETERMREEWMAGVSHDLKTPLSSIKGYAHLLEEKSYEWSQEEIREFGGIMLSKTAYMEGLIQDLSLTHQLRNEEIKPLTEWIELNACLEDIVAGASHNPQLGPDRVRFVPAGQDIVLLLNEIWFRRIADNLIANALLHNAPTASLTVSLNMEIKEDGEYVVIDFTDNGSGMDEETAARLFERYYRGTSTEIASGGTGLGMTVTKALTEALGGKIQVNSRIGYGTSIQLRWPNPNRLDEIG